MIFLIKISKVEPSTTFHLDNFWPQRPQKFQYEISKKFQNNSISPLAITKNSYMFLAILCRLSPKFQVDVCTKFIAATVLLLKELQNAAFHTLLVSQSLNGKKTFEMSINEKLFFIFSAVSSSKRYKLPSCSHTERKILVTKPSL